MLLDGIIPNAVWDAIKLSAKLAKARFAPSEPSPHWMPRLNAYFKGEVQVFCQIAREPIIKIEGPYKLSQDLLADADGEKAKIAAEGRPNDPHAILVGEPQWLSDQPVLRAQTLDFAGVRAMRKCDLSPQVISASAVIVCQQARVLVVHERALDVDTFPGQFHTMGGAYLPPGAGGVDADRTSSRTTVLREVLEEAQLSLSGDQFPPMMMAKELETGFIQTVFLGFNITPRMLDDIVGNWEGTPHCVPFDKILPFLNDSRVVPSGKAHLLAWLALGAPNAGASPPFGGLTPRQIFDVVVSH